MKKDHLFLIILQIHQRTIKLFRIFLFYYYLKNTSIFVKINIDFYLDRNINMYKFK